MTKTIEAAGAISRSFRFQRFLGLQFLVRAHGKDLKAMADRLPSKFRADPISQGSEIGTLKIDRPTSPQAHHDVLRLLAIDELKMRLFGIEKGLRNDARLLKKAEGSIDRRLGNPMAQMAHCEEQLFGFERPVVIDDRLQDVRSFLGVLQPLAP